MLRHEKGFTLIELIVIIVILAAVAIPRYIDLTQQAADGTAKGVLGALRSANALLFGQRILGNTPAAYTMGDIAGVTGMAEIRGFTYTFSDTTFLMTAGGYVYTFHSDADPSSSHNLWVHHCWGRYLCYLVTL